MVQYHIAMLRYEQDIERREQHRQNGHCNFMLFVDHHRAIARYERSRRLRPTDRSFDFTATPTYVFDPDLIQSRTVECPLTPSHAGADDIDNDDGDSQS
ncbi:hypothetical protein Scep_024081 [Stephania cephalantha]|uniref:Uncharacterized protein n=1 Tax=Stephania cephalantha TaxID=152367 RepID=A0AAP0HXX6_9MAGN